MIKFNKWLDKRTAEIECCGNSIEDLQTVIAELGAMYQAGFITEQQFYESCARAKEARDKVYNKGTESVRN